MLHFAALLSLRGPSGEPHRFSGELIPRASVWLWPGITPCVKTRQHCYHSPVILGGLMRRFVEEADRGQWTLLPECLDDFIDESNPVRVIDVFVDALDLVEMSFAGVEPAATGRPSYHPSVLLKLYIYGYLNRVQSSRRLEREAGRNVEVMWLLGRH